MEGFEKGIKLTYFIYMFLNNKSKAGYVSKSIHLFNRKGILDGRKRFQKHP